MILAASRKDRQQTKRIVSIVCCCVTALNKSRNSFLCHPVEAERSAVSFPLEDSPLRTGSMPRTPSGAAGALALAAAGEHGTKLSGAPLFGFMP